MANPASHPEGGVDYPRTLTEFDAWFVSETACAEFLGRVRWPEGFRCPSCCGTDAWPTARGQLRCNRCQRQTSVTAGTIFEGTRKPLRLWFQAMWYVTNQKHGVSALGLQRILGLGSYQTAWAWLHKLRRAMVRPGRDLLGGAVEVDETYVGGRETGVVGRQTKTKSIVAIAAEVRGRGTGRIRMSRVEDVAARSLIPFVQTTVAPGATVRTDGWSAYSGLANQGYDHQPRSISASGDPAHIVMPRVHRVAALLDRVAGHPPWCHRCRPSRLLSRRVHFPIQSPPFAGSCLLSSDCSSRRCSEPVYKGLVGGHRSLGNQMEGIRERSGYPVFL